MDRKSIIELFKGRKIVDIDPGRESIVMKLDDGSIVNLTPGNTSSGVQGVLVNFGGRQEIVLNKDKFKEFVSKNRLVIGVGLGDNHYIAYVSSMPVEFPEDFEGVPILVKEVGIIEAR